MSSKRGGFFPGSSRAREQQKAAGFRRLGSCPSGRDARTSEPLAAAAAAISVTAHAAFHPAMTPALASAEAAVVGQQREPPLLALVERLVERVGRIRDLLQRGGRRRHVVGALAQPRDRVFRLLLTALVVLRLHPRIGAIDAQFRE